MFLYVYWPLVFPLFPLNEGTVNVSWHLGAHRELSLRSLEGAFRITGMVLPE